MKNVPLYIDIAFCLVVLPVMALIFPVERWFHNFQWYVVTVGIWLYAVYFINRGVTVPLLFRGGRKRSMGFALIFISIAGTYALSQVNLYTLKPSIHDNGITRIFPAVLQYRQAIWSLFMIVETFSFAVGLLTQANLQRARRRAVEAEHEKAQIELYKAQIKPHFMFNTLNSLYGLFLTRDSKALECLEKFISVTRYVHTSSGRDFMPLPEEAQYIRQYVDLQSLRLNDMTTVHLDIDIDDNSLNIPPMLLVTFVENCFKHGVSPIEKSDIRISMAEHQGRLTFTTSNRIFPVKRIGEHTGLENCRRRLELLYPGHHSMETETDGNMFHVRLSIDLIQQETTF